MTPKCIWRHLVWLAATGGLVTAMPSASAGPGEQEVYRCNTPNGSADGQVFNFPAETTEFKGKILVHTADIDPKWRSISRVLLHQTGAHYEDGDCGCNGFTVYASKNPDQIEFHMTANGENVSIAQGKYETPISFRMSLNTEGVMTVAIGETNPTIRTLKLRHAEHDTLEISCSGLDVSFLQ